MLTLAGRAHAGTAPSVAFFYGEHPPLDILADFDWVVVQPDALKNPATLAGPHTRVFAYVSLGETETDGPTAHALPAQCRLGENRPWHSWVVDQRAAVCRTFYTAHVIAPLLARGYRDFFFDTLDSYRLVLKTQAQRQAYRNGLVSLIKSIHQADPDGRILLNRGFHLLDALKGQGLVGVAAESLYRGWDQAARRYVALAPSDTHALLARLDHVRRLGLTAIAIDYLPPGHVAQAQQLAERILRHGIVPYVADAQLDTVGVSSITALPRKVLMLYEGAGDAMDNNLNWYAAMPLNHLGYATRTIDVSRAALPSGLLAGQVAGIVTWFDASHFPHSAQTWRWLRRQMRTGVPVAILGDFGMPESSANLLPLGLSLGAAPPPGLNAARIAVINPHYLGFENPVVPSAPDFSPIQLERGTPLLTLGVAGQTEVAAGLTPWGGYCLAPYVLRNLPQGDLPKAQQQAAWILNPFRFFRAALRLPDVPAYDYTTASGRRLLFALIDGDGFSNGSWIGAFHGQPAAQVILDQVLKRFPLPVTASVIASEFTDHGGLHAPAEVAQLRPIARAIFALPWVEIGSHTYSHPFDWSALEQHPDLSAGLHLSTAAAGAPLYVTDQASPLKYGYNLPVPGYRFSARMEVAGSADIINRLLAPPGKKVEIIQWSGDTDPDARVLGIAYQSGLANINGDNSTITRAHPSLTNVVPLGAWKGRYFQVYSPIANEDEFTRGWQPPYCGYAQAIQTMQMTNRPRRLAPMEIYYHFYSGARPCGLASLLEVYRWAQRQSSTPVFASAYSRIAVDFQSAGMATSANGGILALHYGHDQEIRIPLSIGYPALSRSRNIAGYDDFGNQRYVHLGPGGNATLYLQDSPPREPYLRSANGVVRALTRAPGQLTLTLSAQVPLDFTLGNAARCRTRVDRQIRRGDIEPRHAVHFALKAHRARIQVSCGS